MGQVSNFKGFDDWVEVFRTGTHIDSKGVTHTFGTEHLDQMVLNTAPDTAPIVVGHPKMDAPAYGWVQELKRDGDVLLAKFAQVDVDFAQVVEDGKFKKRSISAAKNADGQLYVKHIGWLGAAAPAVKGLKDVQFSESDDDVVMEFGEPEAINELAYLIQTVGNLLRGAREKIIADSDIETADRVFPDWQINSLQTAYESVSARLQDKRDATLAYAEPADAVSEYADVLDQVVATVRAQIEANATVTEPPAVVPAAAPAEFSEREQTLQAENQSLRNQLRQQSIEQQINGWKAVGKVLPADVSGMAEFMGALAETEASFDFAEGDTQTSVTPSQWFANYVERRAGLPLGKEVAGGNAPPTVRDDAQSIKDAAQEYQESQKQKGIDIDWTAAVVHVASQAQAAE